MMTETEGRQAVVARSLTAAILRSQRKDNELPALARPPIPRRGSPVLQFVSGRDRGHYPASDGFFVDADVSLYALNDLFYTLLLRPRGWRQLAAAIPLHV